MDNILSTTEVQLTRGSRMILTEPRIKSLLARVVQMQDMSTEYLQTFGLEIAAIVLTLLIAMLIGIMSITA